MRIATNLLASDNTWTGANTFAGGLTVYGASPLVTFTDTDPGHDDWSLGPSAGSFVISNTTDSVNFFTVTDADDITIGSTGTTGVNFNVGKGNAHVFNVFSAEQFRITTNLATFVANVTISRATPTLTFTDSGGDDYSIDVGAAAASRFRIRNTTDSTTCFDVDGTGHVAISTSYAPQNYIKLYVQERETDPTAGQRQAFGGGLEVLHTSANWSGGNQYAALFGVTVYAATRDFNNGAVAYGGNFQGQVASIVAGRTVNNIGALFGTIALSGTGGTVSNSSNFRAYTTVSGGVVAANHTCFSPGTPTASGGSSITTLTGYEVPVQTGGGTNYEMLFLTTAKANFRDANQYIQSSAASTLDISANTTTNFRVAGTSVAAIASGFMLESKAAGNESTGAGTPAAGTNCPAVTVTAPYTWLKFKTSDGSTVYVAAYK